MANTFKNKTSRSIGISLTAIQGYTVPTSTTTVVISGLCANTAGSTILVDVTLNDGTNDTYIVKNVPIPAGNSLTFCGGDESKIILEYGHSIKAKSDTATSLDVILGILEIA